VPSCAEAGVLGVLPGIVGTLQASEAVKWLAGLGAPMVGRLLVFDALAAAFREVRLRKNPDCPRCSERPTLAGLVRYEEACAVPESDGAESFEIGPAELARRRAAGEPMTLLDVRLAREREIAVLDDDLWIPLQELAQRWHEVPTDRRVVVYCHVGGRSAQAAAFLRGQGLERVASLTGGIRAWSREVDPTVPQY
jgi:adenylyltransferase/sulfurtransferase